MAKLITLRVFTGDHDADVLEWIKAQSPCHFVVCHDVDNDDKRPHWHAIMWVTKTDQALRVAFTKKFPALKGNGAYSIKPITQTLDVFERYLCHGKEKGDLVQIVSAQAPVDGVGKYTQEWAQKQNFEFWDRQTEYKERFKKKKSVREATFEDCVASGFKTPREIVDVLMEKYIEADKPMNVFHMRAEVRLLYGKLNRLTYKKPLGDEILRGLEFNI